MNLSISNIGWDVENDEYVYEIMRKYGFTGLEIAPTRIFPDKPYEDLHKAAAWRGNLELTRELKVSSMQSIWYGRSEKIFGTEEERRALAAYTRKAVDFAETIGCENLVFGCPRNRAIPEHGDIELAVRFFKELGDYAYEHHTVIAMEANPPIYHTNFINTTQDALSLVERVDSKGFLLNLDIGTVIENGEALGFLADKPHYIHHIHISEPGLQPIQKRSLHIELAELLNRIAYERFVSIEVGKQEDVASLREMMEYVSNVFHPDMGAR